MTRNKNRGNKLNIFYLCTLTGILLTLKNGWLLHWIPLAAVAIAVTLLMKR